MPYFRSRLPLFADTVQITKIKAFLSGKQVTRGARKLLILIPLGRFVRNSDSSTGMQWSSLIAKVCYLKQLFIALTLDRDVKESDVISYESRRGEER